MQAVGGAPAVHSTARLRSRSPSQGTPGEFVFDDGRARAASTARSEDGPASLDLPHLDEMPAEKNEAAVSIDGTGTPPMSEASGTARRAEAFGGESSTAGFGPSFAETSSSRDHQESGVPAHLPASVVRRERRPGRAAPEGGRKDASSAGAGARAAPLPDVHIHIGRVELAALVPAPTATSAVSPPKGKPPMSLDEYFRHRGRRAP